MKTPREVLLQQHQAATPKLDAIQDAVAASLARRPAPETNSWREWVRSLRWHFAGLSAAWVVVLILNSTEPSPHAMAMAPRDKMPPPQQFWASLREERRLLKEYSETPVEATPTVPGHRSELQPQQVVV